MLYVWKNAIMTVILFIIIKVSVRAGLLYEVVIDFNGTSIRLETNELILRSFLHKIIWH